MCGDLPQRIGVILFSGNPFTRGHLDLAEQALEAEIVDRIVMGVANSAQKKYMFTIEERIALAEVCCRQSRFADSIEIKECPGAGIEFVHAQGSRIIIRGIRNDADMKYEEDMAVVNAEISESRYGKPIHTICLCARQHMANISSTLAREGAFAGFSVSELSRYVLPPVAEALVAKCRALKEAQQ